MLYTPHIRSGLQHLEDLAHFLSTQVVDEVLLILTRSWRAIQPLNLIRKRGCKTYFQSPHVLPQNPVAVLLLPVAADLKH